MTPKEKAEHLFYRFRNLENEQSWVNNHNAKQCALIAVDEILNHALDGAVYGDGISSPFISGTEYWQQVKQEIEKL